MSAFIDRVEGSIKEVRCKVCGAIIKSLQERLDLTKDRRLADGTIVRQVYMILEANALYKELTLLLDNGDKHITHLCSSCVSTVKNDFDRLTELMGQDIAEDRKSVV